MTIILLTNQSQECIKARKILTKTNVPFDELPAHPVWEEIDWPIPSLFTSSKIYKGLEEIESAPMEMHYGKPN
jgi:hypothetical protein